jgi:hypothetical protein
MLTLRPAAPAQPGRQPLFTGDAVPGKEARQGARVRLDAAVSEPVVEFSQEGARVFFLDSKDQGRLRFQPLQVAINAHRFGRDLPVPPVAFVLPDSAGCPDAEAFGRLTLRCVRFNCCHDKLAQIHRQNRRPGDPPS